MISLEAILASYSRETWALSLSGTPDWRQLPPEGAPPAMIEHSAVYDPVRDRMIMIAGYAEVGGYLNRTWALSLETDAWTELLTEGDRPPTERSRSAVYDATRDRVLVYGGDSFDPNFVRSILAGTPTCRWSVFWPAA